MSQPAARNHATTGAATSTSAVGQRFVKTSP